MGGKNAAKGKKRSPRRLIADAPKDVVLYVLDGDLTGQAGPVRPFPLLDISPGEREADYLARIVREVDLAIAAGGTHLLVPRRHADWLGDRPLVANYFGAMYELAEASAETGIVFSLRPARVTFSVETSGWQSARDQDLAYYAPRELRRPTIKLVPDAMIGGLLKGSLAFKAEQLRTLCLRVDLVSGRKRYRAAHQIVLSASRPGFMFHDLPFVEATFAAAGAVHVEFELALRDDRAVDRLVLEVVEEDNWRMHPAFISAESYALPAVAPAGARIALLEAGLERVSAVRHSPPYGVARGSLASARRSVVSGSRDAVLFSSWVPEKGLELGDYFLDMLRRWRPDAKFFVGVNHGSSPRWSERLAASGLDVTIAPVPATLEMPCDPAGFVAALDAFRQDTGSYELVWFGHTKGMSHRRDPRYATGRWTIERMFWSRREEIARHFADPTIGLYAPHYLMMKQSHLRELDALARMYRAPYRPLGVLALSTHFVMRGKSVREFCAGVDPLFFREGPAPFGGDIYFFEMGMPNVPLAQGYELAIEPGLGATAPTPPEAGVSIQNDWRQNHAVVAAELERWRRDPVNFRTDHREHRYVP
jgi:hypothetical protein